MTKIRAEQPVVFIGSLVVLAVAAGIAGQQGALLGLPHIAVAGAITMAAHAVVLSR